MRFRHAALLALLTGCCAPGQTLVDLRTQTKDVDFSGANTTKPFKSGTLLPGTCGVGEAFPRPAPRPARICILAPR